MKEAIGGSWLYTLVIVMIALFTTFVSVTTNYTRTFRIKDNLITIIEKHGGVTGGNGGTLQEINQYLDSLGYATTGECPKPTNNVHEEGTKEDWHAFSRTDNNNAVDGYGNRANYCIYKHVVSCRVKNKNVKNADGTPAKSVITYSGEMGYNTLPRAYYGVLTFFRLDWPIIRQIVKVELSGETATMFLPNTNYEVDAFKDDSFCKEEEK